ncbi:MAG: hypothetical protein JKY88_17735 [Pseudomonadales bacterium]|nr:hypothetical protein [Pseudomonadales bacterium]
MEQIKARLGENSTYLGAAILAFIGGKYGPDAAQQVTEFLAIGLGLVATVRGDKAGE